MRIKLQNKKEWHASFVLFPRIINNTFVWLECIYRREVFKEWGWYEGGYVWEYRLEDVHGTT